MKAHTNKFKEEIGSFGRQLDSIITYQINGVTKTLTNEDLNSVTPNFQSAILKSAMKCLEIDSNIDIPLGTILNYKFGVKVGNEYEYLDYGNYIVYSSERQEDTESYKLICYDKMLYSMKNYDDVFEKNEVTYPITLRNFINLIATKMGIGFKDINTNFANYDKQISKELFYGLGYTLRDILDQCAEATASTICISDDDKLEIRYINDLNEVNSITGTNLIINDAFDYPVKKLTFDGRSTQETTNGDQLYDVKDVFSFSSGVTVDNDDWITISCDNTSGTSTKYFDFKTKISENVQPSTTYDLFVEIKSVSGNGTINFVSNQTIGQSATYSGNSLANLSVGTIKPTFTTKDDFTGCTNFLNSYATFSAGQSGSITFRISVLKANVKTLDNFVYEPFSGVQPSPSPDYPIEIESIEGIVQYKQIGKNLFNSALVQNVTIKGVTWVVQDDGGINISGSNKSTSNVSKPVGGWSSTVPIIELDPKKTYTLSFSGNFDSKKVQFECRGLKDGAFDGVYTLAHNSTITGFSAITYLNFYARVGATDINETIYFMIAEGSDTNFKKYEETILNINLQGNKLCSLSNGVKDELIVENGRAKIIKNVQEDLLDGVNKKFTSIALRGTKTFLICNYSNSNIKKVISENEVIPLSNKFRSASIYDTWNGVIQYGISQSHNGHYLQFSFPKTIVSDLTLAGLNTWLASNNTKVQYQLETPIEIDLGEVTQPKTFDGVNNISNSENTNMSVEYTNNWETIDEEFFKDVNVNFGEDYGPVNSVVLSRAETDNVYLQDEDSIEKNGLCEIKITNNQIMNWEDRSTYLPDILKKLDGLKYYLNDFSTFGITYLELCDKYNVKIRDNNYLCIFFNHELEITQGVEEKVYTEMPEQTETDYTKADKVERQIKNTSIIVDKQKQEIALKLDKGEFTHAQIVAKINDDTSQVQIEADQISLAGKEIDLTSDNITINSNNFKVDKDGKITSTSGKIGGYNIEKKQLFAEMYAPHNYTLNDAETARKIADGSITPTAEQIAYYDVDGDGVVSYDDYYKIRIYYEYHITTTNSAKFILQTGDFIDSAISLFDGNNIPIASLGFKGLILEGSISYHTTKSTDIFGKASFCRTLYDNPEGTNQTITLEYDEQFTSLFYNELEIIYGHEDYGYSSCKIPISSSSESYKVNLSASVWLSNIFYQTSSLLTISDNTATFSNSVKVTNGSREDRTTSILKVYRIVGYFEG